MSTILRRFGGGPVLTAVPARLTTFARRHPTWADSALAVAMLVLVDAGSLLRASAWAALGAALTLPLALRRRAPVPVFAVLAVVALAQWSLDVRTAADMSLLVALYTVAAHCDRARTLYAVAVVEAGILLVTVRWTEPDYRLGAFVGLSAMTVTAAVLGANLRTRRRYLLALEDRADRLEREQEQQAALAVAAERSRIAREMHDIVTHNLSVMVALADAAAMTVRSTPDRAGLAMEQVSGTGRQALTEMRRFLGILREDEPEAARHPQPDLARLGGLAEQVRAAGLPTTLTVEGDARDVPQGAQLAVYRLVQEALTNTLKHTLPGASARILVRCSPAHIELNVVDDGRARAPGSGAGAGSGVTGMRERAAVYGGHVEAGPLADGGWRVFALLNLTDPGGS
ncbi:histidine kinase [Embleya sp. NBC_00896]|uniref:sensor histidine kinase n=1 Tax=Embleya sp. NBC_00896 TaxID=2975961 RepID=UPI002F912CAA|nr:histidine kinase [Embleya sp. NBC_00896]